MLNCTDRVRKQASKAVEYQKTLSPFCALPDSIAGEQTLSDSDVVFNIYPNVREEAYI